MRVWVFGAIVLICLAIVGWKASRPPTVETIEARLENVTSTLAVSGVLEARDRSTLACQLSSALVKEVKVDIGDIVKQGDILIVLDNSDANSQMLAADATIQQAESQIQLQNVLANNASKAVMLAREGLGTISELRLAVASATTSRAVAQAKVKQAIVNLQRVSSSSRIEQVKIAIAQFDKARTAQQLSDREARRSQTLYAAGAISQRENEVAQAAANSAARDLEVAGEQVRVAGSPRPEDVKTAESQVAEAQSALVGAEQVLALSQRAMDDRLAGRQQLQVTEGTLNTSIATKRVSEVNRLTGIAQKSAAASLLAKTVIRSPLAGRVSQRLVEPGQTVTAGTPLLVLAGTAHLRVRLNVDESSIAQVKNGAKAIVGFDAYPDLQLPAIVSEIGSSANFQLGTLEVRLKLLSKDPRLKPELTADANIIVAEFSQVVVVPRSALIVVGEVGTVLVAANGIATTRTVRWSNGNADSVVILSGIKVGEKVLTNPRSTKSGSQIVTVNAKLKGAG